MTKMDIDFKQWQYYLSLEEDFIRTLRFVELDKDNFDTYSIEFSKLLLLIGAEFESVTKELIHSVDATFKIGDISDIKGGILKYFPEFCENEVRIPKYKFSHLPFNGWNNGEKLMWWDSYNSLKHNRLGNFKQANLETILYSIGGLLIALVYLYRYRDDHKHLVSWNEFIETDGMGDPVICSPQRDIADKRQK